MRSLSSTSLSRFLRWWFYHHGLYCAKHPRLAAATGIVVVLLSALGLLNPRGQPFVFDLKASVDGFWAYVHEYAIPRWHAGAYLLLLLHIVYSADSGVKYPILKSARSVLGLKTQAERVQKQARRKARLALQERLRRALPAIDWDLESSCVRNTKAAVQSRQKRRRRARPAAEWTLQMDKVRRWSHRWREHECVQDAALGGRWREGDESEGSESEEEEYGKNAGEQPRESCAEGEDQGFVVLACPVFLAEFTDATAWPPVSGTSRREEHQQDEGFVVVGCAEVLAAAEEDECGAAVLSESNEKSDSNSDNDACADLADVTAWPPLPGASRREEHQAAGGTYKEVTAWARTPCALGDVAGTSGSDCLDAPARPRSGAGGRREAAGALSPPSIADVLLWVGDGEGAEDWELVDERNETTTRH